ncbi:hypothetical protein Scep_001205 [Stephania cephalantha]|uniref:Uncharacterized protein n=1 Tax=Stephania cephalantha TaxID=152367 RepID=A0AAP0Q4U4_9MAGN
MVLVPQASHHDTLSPQVHALPLKDGTIPSLSHHSTPSPPGYVYPHEHGIMPSSSHHATPSPSTHPAHSPVVGDEHTSTSRVIHWDLQMSFAIYDAWCQGAYPRHGNIYLIAKKRITSIYLTEEVFEHYKRMRATDEAFNKKSEQMSTNRKSGVGGPSTGISLHSAGNISARQHDDTLWSQGYHRKDIFVGSKLISRTAYGPHELEELQAGTPEVARNIVKERMERQEQMQMDKMERQEENREMQDRLARMEALLM